MLCLHHAPGCLLASPHHTLVGSSFHGCPLMIMPGWVNGRCVFGLSVCLGGMAWFQNAGGLFFCWEVCLLTKGWPVEES